MIRKLNLYEKNLVKEALASLTIKEANEIKKHIPAIKTLEAEAEAEAEALEVFKTLEAEAITEAKAEVFKTSLAEAKVTFLIKEAIAEAKAETEALIKKAEAEAEAKAEVKEAEAYKKYYEAKAEASKIYNRNQIIAKALFDKAEADLIEDENSIQYQYNNTIALAIAEGDSYIDLTYQYLEAQAEALAEASIIELINLIDLSKLSDFLKLKTLAEAKAFNYVYNNIDILAEAEVKEASAKAKALVKEVLIKEAEAEVKALVLTAEAFNNIEPYNKSIISNYINFNSLAIKTKLYNKFEHQYINSIISLNIMLFDNTYYIIIANDKVLNKLSNLVSYKNLSYKDKRSLKTIKKASNKEAKASNKLEAEASYINNILEAEAEAIAEAKAEFIASKYINRYNLKLYLFEALNRALEVEALAEAEAEAIAEAKAEVKSYLKDLAINNYFKFLRLKDLTLITEAEAEAFLTEALASNNQYKLNTYINDYYNNKEVFKNKKSQNKVTKDGLTSKISNRYNTQEAITEALASNVINLAEVKAEAEAEAKTKYLVRSIFRSLNTNIDLFYILKHLDYYYNLAEALEAEAKALVIQKNKFNKALAETEASALEVLRFKKAIDLI